MDTMITNNYGNGAVLDLNSSNGITLDEPNLERMRVDRLERTRALMKVNTAGVLKGVYSCKIVLAPHGLAKNLIMPKLPIAFAVRYPVVHAIEATFQDLF